VSVLSLRDRDLWYEDSGRGVPIVFLHAGVGSVVMWERQRQPVVDAGYRYVAYDRVGAGRSTLHADAEPGAAVDDLEALRQHLGFDRFHLVGTAAGGIVAFDYVLAFREHLRSLVIANSVGGVQDESYLELGRRLRPPEFERLPVELRELGPSYRAANAEGTARWLELERQSQPARPLASPQRYHQRLTFALLDTISVPTLLLTGDADLYCPPSVLRMFAAHMPGAETLIVPETGHSAYWEQTELFNGAVLAFVAKHAR
jgi:pimeloyl-ACP methyl ester carboxylesterase